MRFSDLRSAIARVLFEPPLLALMERIPVVRDHCRGWRRTHPIDRQLGVETSGFVPVDKLQADPRLAEQMNPYAGCVPSVVRKALGLVPDLTEYTLVDLGCGKGRSLVVASEFPFRRIIGIDLSHRMVRVARDNARIIARRFPERTPVEVEVGNAALFPLGDEKKVAYFLYNSFPPAVMTAFVAHLEAELRRGVEHIFLIYCNAFAHQAIDASPSFVRWSAETIAIDPSESGFGPDADEAVVIWQSVPARFQPRPGAERRIVTPEGETHAQLRD